MLRLPSLAAILLILVLAASSAADIENPWSLPDPPVGFELVADLSVATGLEGLFWETASHDLRTISFTDFADLGTLSFDPGPARPFLFALDLDPANPQAELVTVGGTRGGGTDIVAYAHDGIRWNLLWTHSLEFVSPSMELQVVDLNVRNRGEHLLAVGQSLEIIDPATGLSVWTSTDPATGLGTEWRPINWTLADYDQHRDGGDELLVDFLNTQTGDAVLYMLNETTGSTSTTPLRSTAISMGPSRPNPMVNATTVSFDLPRESMVRLNIYDVRGRRVSTLAERRMAPGNHTIRWDGTDRTGARVAQGVYFYELRAGGERLARKMLVVR